MVFSLLLASASPVRCALLENAGLSVEVKPARIDEPALRDSLLAEGAGPRDIADALAEMNIHIDRRKIALVDPIRQLGVYSVDVLLHEEVTAAVKVWVVRA